MGQNSHNNNSSLAALRESPLFVETLPEEDRMLISFTFDSPSSSQNAFSKSKPQYLRLHRSRTENVQSTLVRMAQSLQQKFSHKKKKKKDFKMPQHYDEWKVRICLHNSTGEVIASSSDAATAVATTPTTSSATSLTLEEALQQTSTVVFDDSLVYRVHWNVPIVKSVKLPKHSLMGCPLVPILSCVYIAPADCKYAWWTAPQQPHWKHDLSSPEHLDSQEWTLRSTQAVFTPAEEDVGKWVKVCVQGNALTASVEAFLPQPVATCPEQRALHQRSAVGRLHFPAFRVISYNILANIYTDSDYSRQTLFPYCPTEFLHMNYRQFLIVRELMQYQADIIGLQEVDDNFYNAYFKECLQSRFDSVLLLKTSVREGQAMFYRRDRFTLVENASIPSLTDVLHSNALFSDLRQALEAAPLLLEKLAKRSQGVIMLVLQDSNQHHICVVNTHLFFSPDACNIRVIQAYLIVRQLRAVLTRYPNCRLVMMGDWNASRNSGLYQFITTGELPAEASDWLSAGTAEHFGGFHMRHEFGNGLQAAYPEARADGARSNFTLNFKEDLDHIFFLQNNLTLLDTLPLPSCDDLREFVALPNEHFPSDHVAVGAEFCYA